jgi:hypothetical protein
MVAGTPTNLRLPIGSKLAVVESDMHNICGRIAEITDQLTVHVAEDPSGQCAFIITERVRMPGRDEEQLVLRVGPGCEIDALDGRVIDKINFIRMFTPAERVVQLEKQIARDKAAAEDFAREKLWEELGSKMYANARKWGFSHDTRVEQIPTLTKAKQRSRSGKR